MTTQTPPVQINQQSPLGISRNENGELLVHSMFHTIQGEGPYGGYAAYFIRLYGCNLQCPGCDTDYTSASKRWSAERLYAHVATERSRGDLIVITGGEPFRQNLTPFVNLLLDAGYHVQIETNGTLWIEGFPAGRHTSSPDTNHAEIICSPKTAKIHPELAQRVLAFKYVIQAGHVAEDGLPIDALENVKGLGRLTKRNGSAWQVARPPEGWEGPIYVQPMDEKDEEKNARNAQVCTSIVMNFRAKHYILGFQMHKAVNVP